MMQEWKPVVCSIEQARKCLGGISRTKFYTSVLPELETVAKSMGKRATIKIGGRRLVLKDVLHALIDRLTQLPAWAFIGVHLYAIGLLGPHGWI